MVHLAAGYEICVNGGGIWIKTDHGRMGETGEEDRGPSLTAEPRTDYGETNVVSGGKPRTYTRDMKATGQGHVRSGQD